MPDEVVEAVSDGPVNVANFSVSTNYPWYVTSSSAYSIGWREIGTVGTTAARWHWNGNFNSNYITTVAGYDSYPRRPENHNLNRGLNLVIDEPAFASVFRLPETPEAPVRRRRAVVAGSPDARARELLVSLLSPQQRESYERNEQFDVVGSLGNLYRIRRGSMGNIDWLTPDGKVQGTLCAHPSMREAYLPLPDVAAAQLLALTTDEAAFVRLANVHWGRRPPVPQIIAA